MKVRLTREQYVRNLSMTKEERHRQVDRCLRGEITKQELAEMLRTLKPAGTVIDHPKAFRLVQLGVAEPMDNDSIVASSFSDAQITAAQLVSERLESGNALPDELADQNADS
jgi:hypothetical protein